MLATHVDPHGLVTACACLSAWQSNASASYPKLATEKTAAQWGQTLTTAATQQRKVHTNNSVTEAAEYLNKTVFLRVNLCRLQ